jgi:WD40 repeat protein
MIKVWDLAAGLELFTLSGHSDSGWAVAMRADGLRAISASDDGTLKLWNLVTGYEICTFAGHSDYVRGVAMTADGRLAISASFDKPLRSGT